jgi:hypothetical protein
VQAHCRTALKPPWKLQLAILQRLDARTVHPERRTILSVDVPQ